MWVVAIYADNGPATAVALFVFCLLLLGLLLAIQHTNSHARPWLPYVAAAVVCLLLSPFLYLALVW